MCTVQSEHLPLGMRVVSLMSSKNVRSFRILCGFCGQRSPCQICAAYTWFKCAASTPTAPATGATGASLSTPLRKTAEVKHVTETAAVAALTSDTNVRFQSHLTM